MNVCGNYIWQVPLSCSMHSCLALCCGVLWCYATRRWSTPDNPHGIWRPAISNSTLVLHYAYATPGDVAVKAGRSCPPGVVEAVLAGNTSQVKTQGC